MSLVRRMTGARDAMGRPAVRRLPDGINGIRDVDSRCEIFHLGEPADGDCMGDGHFLCAECVHWQFVECDDCGERFNLHYAGSHKCPTHGAAALNVWRHLGATSADVGGEIT